MSKYLTSIPSHLAINDMDNVITDYDYYDPMTFYDIADRLDKVISDIK